MDSSDLVAVKLKKHQHNSTSKLEKISNPVLEDYYAVAYSRHLSLIGRKEVFRGRAKFGIFGDGKELPQIAMAKVFRKGDFRSGYYRDQTFMMAAGMLTGEEHFAQLFAHADLDYEPSAGGRCMNGHFSTQSLDENGEWLDLMNRKNSSSDVSPTSVQMPRLIGLGYASKLFRETPDFKYLTNFSNNGNEIAFGTIGNASCAEGTFWESVNAMAVLQIPVLLSIWDDGYGISVDNSQQIAKSSVGEVLKGFEGKEKGITLYTVDGYDYEGLCEVYEKAEKLCRQKHRPVVVYVKNLTQPLGHSTSGSHERYKSKDRLEWEKENDCFKRFSEWIIKEKISDETSLKEIEEKAKKNAKTTIDKAWENYSKTIQATKKEILVLLEKITKKNSLPVLEKLAQDIKKENKPWRFLIIRLVRRALMRLKGVEKKYFQDLVTWLEKEYTKAKDRYSSHLYCENKFSALLVKSIPAEYSTKSPELDGYQVLNHFFDKALNKYKNLFAIGEDLGKLGGVNQAFAGLQKKYGVSRVDDTGIREATIIGQGIGASLRGLRPIVEIQYIDYILLAFHVISDDLATIHYRTKGRQTMPLIIRTRGHRYEGIWHSGSPMASLVHAFRGIYVLVPRNMVQAAGFYNTMLQSYDSALIVECLNGYRQKEILPDNVGIYTVPLGIPEYLRYGDDITLVTYGSMCRIVMEAASFLETMNISCEVIDIQSLLPLDTRHEIVKSVQKTSRLIVIDEDVPGGASAYILEHILNVQNAYKYLDSKPLTISSKAHRPAYASDGNYFSKPNAEDIIEKVYNVLHEAKPQVYLP